jgi:hypothetical protein
VQDVVEDRMQRQFEGRSSVPDRQVRQDKFLELLQRQTRRNLLPLLAFRHFDRQSSWILPELAGLKQIQRRCGFAANSRIRETRNQLKAYHVHVQLACIAQGLLQHLAINHTAAVWHGFRSWLRTINEAMPPSELVVASALRTGLPGFFAACELILGLKKIVQTYRRYDATQENQRSAA